MKTRLPHALIATAVLALGAVTTTPAVADGLVTHCRGTASSASVPGDLVVPKGESCDLTDTTVAGSVTVRADADLLGKGVEVDGALVGASGSYVELSESKIGGDLKLTDAYGAVVEQSTIAGKVSTMPGQGDASGRIFASDVDIDGPFTIRSGEVYIEDSTITGSLDSKNSVFTDVKDVFVDKQLKIDQAEDGSMLCAVTVAKNADITDNGGPLQVGPSGSSADCSDGSIYVGKTLAVTGNTGGVVVDDVIVSGDLNVARNEPAAVIGEMVRVRGTVSNTDNGAEVRSSARSVGELDGGSSKHRDKHLRDAVAERSQNAHDEAAATGSAGLS